MTHYFGILYNFDQIFHISQESILANGYYKISRDLIPCENEFPANINSRKINSNNVTYCPLRRGMSFYLLYYTNKRNCTINKSQFSMKVINKYIEVCLEFAKPWYVFCRLFVCFRHLKNAKISRNYKGGGDPSSLYNLNISIYRNKIIPSPFELFLTGQ